MRFFELFESSQGEYSEEVEEFIERNENTTSDAFVTFSDNDQPEVTDYGIHVIPLSAFVNKPHIYKDLIDDNTILKLDVNSDLLHINKVTRKSFVRYMTKLGIEKPLTTHEEIMREYNYPNKTLSYGFVLNHTLSHSIKDGEVTDTKLPINGYINGVTTLGFSGIIDGTVSRTLNIFNNAYGALGYLFNNASFTVDEVVKTSSTVKVVDDVEMVVQALAEKVADALKSGLNQDDPYHRGVDHYFWTYDGIQIRITESFPKANDPTPTFILDIESPYGYIFHQTNEEDSIDDISSHIKEQYSLMNEPLSTWRPMDRDVFLSNRTFEYKDWEMKLEDIVNEVKKYYEDMRKFAMRYDIILEPITFYSEYDMSLMSGIMDRFSQYKHATNFISKISDDGKIRDMRKLDDHFPRQVLPRKMTYQQLHSIAVVYDHAKKLQPKRSGWRLFYDN